MCESISLGRVPRVFIKKFLFWISFGSLSFLCFLTSLAWGGSCQKWGLPRIVGYLDASKIPEASGIAASKKFKNRLYHINDSGNEFAFFITDLTGANTQTVGIHSSTFRFPHPPEDDSTSDFEDLSLGPCFSNDSCLFVADIGDNGGFADSSHRDTITILVFKEQQNMSSPLRPIREIILSYPDGSHNAEGFAVHPNGDIFILTKEMNLWGWEAFPAQLYKIARSKWEKPEREVLQLTKVGELDIPNWVPPQATLFGKLVTSFDISPDGTRFLVLTYDFAFEIFRDLSKSDSRSFRDLQQGKDFHLIQLLTLPQPEGITYLPIGQSFLYHTEYSGTVFRFLRGHDLQKTPPALTRVDCAIVGSP